MKYRFHLPERARWTCPEDRPGNEQLEATILAALDRAVRKAIPAGSPLLTTGIAFPSEARDRYERQRALPGRGQYLLPSYDEGGVLKPVNTVNQDAPLDEDVVEGSPPFAGDLILTLPGNQYIHAANSGPHAYSPSAYHAYIWGKLLFPTTAWALVSQHNRTGVKYFAAALEDVITDEDLKVHNFEKATGAGAIGVFQGSVMGHLPSGFYVNGVYFVGGGWSAPDAAHFTDFSEVLAASRQHSPAFDRTKVRAILFKQIDDLLATGANGDLERAAALLARLDSLAFSLLDANTRFLYIQALVNAWTDEPQEKAIVEILKSVLSREELDHLVERLRNGPHGLWNTLFADLDSQLWSLLTTVGEKFGGKTELTVPEFWNILLEARLVNPAPAVTLEKDPATGELKPVYSITFWDDVEEAARSSLRFIGDLLASIKMLITRPDRLIEGIGQLGKMIAMSELSNVGYAPAVKYMHDFATQIGRQLVYGLQGAAILAVGDKALRRAKWALIFEVASMFIGVGEAKAAISALGISEKLRAFARLLRIAGLIGKTAEAASAEEKLTILVRLMTNASKVLAEEEQLAQVLAHLPEEDLAVLMKAVEKAEIKAGSNFAALAAEHPELAAALRKAEVLHDFAKASGGFTDNVLAAFKRMSVHSKLAPDEIRFVLGGLPAGEGPRVAKALAAIPEAAFQAGGGASLDFIIALASHPAYADALTAMGYGTFASLFRQSGMDAEKFEQYLGALTELEKTFPVENRAIEFRRLLDELSEGKPDAWRRLEDARVARYAPQEAALNPETIEKWIQEELAKAGFEPGDFGAEPVALPASTPPRPAKSFREALQRVDLTTAPPETLAQLKAEWRKYSRKPPPRMLKSEDEYIRFIYGRRTQQLPKVVSGGILDLGFNGNVEKTAGHILEKVVDAGLPPGSSNTTAFPVGFPEGVAPDHLPLGSKKVFLNADGTVSATGSGAPFSADFVGDSKYRDAIPTTNQTRGFVRLAQHSDMRKLVFYVRWKDEFNAANLLSDYHGLGYVLPDSVTPSIVQAGIRDEARQLGVRIELVSNPKWR